MRIITVVVLIIFTACSNDDLPYQTFTDADGVVRTQTDCPSAETQISGGAPDGLPMKGQTELARVEELAAASLDSEVVPRNGEVWSQADGGAVTVEQVEDFMILITISDVSRCPDTPMFSNGVPIIYRVGD
ncbi:MAG TPA: hypothetical protein VFZ80_03385 [Acidimicrobiia bacterium]